MITSRAGVVTIVLVAFIVVLAALSGEPMAERVEHNCSPPRTMPPSLSRLFQIIASAFAACRTALALDATFAFALLVGSLVARPVPETRPIAPIRI